MPKGRFCSRCHTSEEKSYLPFKQLGFSERRISDITNLNIIGLVEKYKTFYMPKLLNSNKSNLSEKEQVESNSQQKSSKDNMRKDPRTWWKEQYDPKN